MTMRRPTPSVVLVLSALAATAAVLLMVACGMMRSPDFVRWEVCSTFMAAMLAFLLGYVCGKQDGMASTGCGHD